MTSRPTAGGAVAASAAAAGDAFLELVNMAFEIEGTHGILTAILQLNSLLQSTHHHALHRGVHKMRNVRCATRQPT